MRLFLLTLGISFFLPAYAQTWLKIAEERESGIVVDLDKSSITKYQGMVSFKIRVRFLSKEESSLTMYDQFILLCSSGEVWDVANDIIFGDSRAPVYKVEPRSAGPTFNQRAKLAARNQRIVEVCKRPNSKVPFEVPIVDGSDIMLLLLAHETKVTGGLVHVWTKEQQTRDETSLDSQGKPLVIDGKTITRAKVVANSDYSLVNWLINCKEETSAIMGIYKYAADGRSKTIDVIPRQQLNFTPNVPGSIGRAIHDFSCALR